MKRDRIFIVVFALLFVVYVVADFFTPKPVDWTVTFHTDDKNPFGAYILANRSGDLFEDGITTSFETISSLIEEQRNLLILAEHADIKGVDQDQLSLILDSGNSVLVAASSFASSFLDSLRIDIHTEYRLLNQDIFEVPMGTLQLEDSTNVDYPSSLLMNYFELEDLDQWKVIATVDGNPVVIKETVGKGELILCSIPHIFANFGLLYNNNYVVAAKLLSLLPAKDVHYTMFYQSGRMEATTPFRYFLREPALRWSLYLGLFLVMAFLLISSWRKQRAIPVIVPPPNTTVEYVKTLGALFYREADHKKAAMRLINHFTTQIKEKYLVQVDFSERFYQHLSGKSGLAIETVIRTFELIAQIRLAEKIDQKTLIDLSKKIETFHE